ncbi:MAG TPA: sigma-70 family RNA polymerase sigma factor [Solirubrobacterales bacterium]|nr:sigma-70 family RNA polymerase sigma factor [Solirubrobacterales bacterium]
MAKSTRPPGLLKRRLGSGRRPDREERRLAAALRAGDAEAITAVEERYGNTLSGFLYQALPDAASAEEVRQQVLLEVWRRGPQYDPERGSPLTWILTIARSRAIDEMRRRRPEPVDPAQMPEREGEDQARVDQMLERWRLSDLLQRIPAEEALTLRLRFYEDKSQTEIAAETGLALGTVKHRMISGLSRLRTLIVEEGAS